MSEVVQFGHPDADELNAFMEHALPDEAREQTLAHLAVCPDCRMVVMLAGEPADSIEAAAVEVRRWWRMPVWVWALPVAGVLVFVMVHRGGAPVERAPIQQAGVMVPAPPPPAAKAAPVSPVETRRKAVSGKEVAKLPLASRDAAPVAPARGMAGMVAGQFSAGAGVGRVQAPEPQPPAAVGMGSAASAAPPVPVTAAAAAPVAAPPPKLPQAMASASDSTSFAAAPEELDRMMGAMAAAPAAKAVGRALPSGLAVVSGVTGAGATLALDSGNHLYVTRDGGAHWVAVAAQWSGKAVRVGLVGSAPVSVDADSNASATILTGAALDTLSDDPSGSPVTGVVTDPGGAVIPGALVTLSNAVTKAVVRTAVTDKNGRYAMAAAAGNYSLEAQKAGFSRDEVRIAVAPGTTVNANMSMAVGAESTVIEVQASNADLETMNATVGEKVEEKKAKAPMKAMARSVPKVEPVFELVTENGEHWVSVDGSSWKKK
jgi:hypothetical protein